MKEIVCSDLPASWQEELRIEAAGSSDVVADVLASCEGDKPRRTVTFYIPDDGVTAGDSGPADVTFLLDEVRSC